MEFHTFYDIASSISLFLLALFSVFLLSLKSGDRLSHRLLAFTLICFALSYMDGLFIGARFFIHSSYAHIVYLTMSFDFLVGPGLWLYLQSRTCSDFSIKLRHSALLLPFVLHFSFLYYRYHQHSLEFKQSLLSRAQVFSYSEVYLLTSISNGFNALCFTACIYLLWRYRNALKMHYSNIHKLNSQWLMLLVIGLLCAGLMRFSNNLWWLHRPEDSWHQIIDLKIFAITLVMLFTTSLVFFALKSQDILHVPRDELFPKLDFKTPTSSIQPFEEGLKHKLLNIMREQQPYLDPDLSLTTLAELSGIRSRKLSDLINTGFGKSFYDFVNDYRLNECKHRLSSEHYRDKNITSIMYDVGFRSKSVFNSTFKKQTGYTPSTYRKLHNSKHSKSA